MNSKVDLIERDGIIELVYPNAQFKVRLLSGGMVRAVISGRMRKFYVGIVPGDKVKLELKPYDLTKGRIVQRYRVNDSNTIC